MRLISVIAIAVLMSGCSALKTSQEELKQNPGSKTVLHSERNYQDVHKMLSERAKSCIAHKFLHSETRADSELYSDQKLGVVQIYVPSLTGAFWTTVVETKESPNGGCDIVIYRNGVPDKRFEKWLSGNNQTCDPQ